MNALQQSIIAYILSQPSGTPIVRKLVTQAAATNGNVHAFEFFRSLSFSELNEVGSAAAQALTDSDIAFFVGMCDFLHMVVAFSYPDEEDIPATFKAMGRSALGYTPSQKEVMDFLEAVTVLGAILGSLLSHHPDQQKTLPYEVQMLDAAKLAHLPATIEQLGECWIKPPTQQAAVSLAAELINRMRRHH
jgi:hypothetical protein